ncbi:MAG: YihY/virulence factor BrkB family protein [Nitrospirae bacterium]|nr:YihY/virulence factor BrkB family protein [Nitrospirota bacterium]
MRLARLGGANNPFIRAVGKFFGDGGPYMAAAISYYALMSLIPLLFIIINIFAYFLGNSPDLHRTVMEYVRTLYPMAGDTLSREITRVIDHSELGWISLVIFFWLASMVFNSLEYYVNTIFKSEKRRRFLVSTLMSFAMVVLAGVLLMVSFWVAYIPSFIERHETVIVGSGMVAFVTSSVVLQLMPLLFTFVAFTLLYKLLPKGGLPWRLAAFGGLITAVMWEAAKYGFAWYVASVGSIGSIYGSFSAVIMFLLWVYYSSVILLYVSELLYLMGAGK